MKLDEKKAEYEKMMTRAENLAAIVALDIQYIKAEISEIKVKLDSQYVTQIEFKPIKQIVFGMVSFILVGVLGAIVALVIK